MNLPGIPLQETKLLIENILTRITNNSLTKIHGTWRSVEYLYNIRQILMIVELLL